MSEPIYTIVGRDGAYTEGTLLHVLAVHGDDPAVLARLVAMYEKRVSAALAAIEAAVRNLDNNVDPENAVMGAYADLDHITAILRGEVSE